MQLLWNNVIVSFVIQITGVQKDIDEVVAAIKEEMRLYDADKEDRQLRSYEIQVFSLFKL